MQRAIERYDSDGLESVTQFHNSVAAFEGQFYLFAMDENDICFIHPLFPRLIGTDIKDAVGSDGFELGREIAKATEEGIWVEYLWPHPVTLREAEKVTFAIRHDGRIFASGHYPAPENRGEHTQAYVQAAIDRYQSEGLDATVAYYSSTESFDGATFLFLVGTDDSYLVLPLLAQRIGTDVKLVRARRVDGVAYNFGEEIASVTDDGRWFHNLSPGVQGAGSAAHIWVIRHDGLIFGAAYFDDDQSSGERCGTPAIGMQNCRRLRSPALSGPTHGSGPRAVPRGLAGSGKGPGSCVLARLLVDAAGNHVHAVVLAVVDRGRVMLQQYGR